MNIRIYNARILTMEEGSSLFGGELHVKGNRIAYVGPTSSDAEGSWDREIDAKGNVIMPGFKNAHTHSAMTFLRSYADDLPLLDWLNEQVFPMEAKLTPEDIYHLSKLAIMEYLTSGITANFDMYLTPDTIADASRECGFRTVMVGGLNNFSQSFEALEEWFRKYNEPEDLVSFQLGFHAEYTNSRENLEKLASLSHKYQAPLCAHSSESKSEVEGCIERYGMTPTALFDSLGMLDYGGTYYHCIHMTDEDIDIINYYRQIKEIFNDYQLKYTSTNIFDKYISNIDRLITIYEEEGEDLFNSIMNLIIRSEFGKTVLKNNEVSFSGKFNKIMYCG